MIAHAREIIARRRYDLGGVDRRSAAKRDDHSRLHTRTAELGACRVEARIIGIGRDIRYERSGLARRAGDPGGQGGEYIVGIGDETIGPSAYPLRQLVEGLGAKNDLDRIPVSPNAAQ